MTHRICCVYISLSEKLKAKVEVVWFKNFSLRPKSETTVSDFGLRLKFRSISAKDKVTQ